MCFSASASLVASGYLASIGVLCLYKNRYKKAIPFAAIPMLFAIQQFSEGVLWLSFTHNWLYGQMLMPYIFLLFAFFIWPIWIPISMILIEPKEINRKHLVFVGMIGFIVAFYLYSHLLLYGVLAQPLDCHIYYDVFIGTEEITIGTFSYLLATIMPFFITSLPTMHLFGLVLLASYCFSYIFYFTHLISVWCFFAALLSGCVYLAIAKLNNR